MTTTIVPLDKSRYWDGDMVPLVNGGEPIRPLEHTDASNHYDSWQSEMVLRFGKVRYGLGFIGPMGVVRKVQYALPEPGPYAFCFGLASVIDNYGGTGAESARLKAKGLEVTVETGDEVVFNGTTWIVGREPFGAHMTLTVKEVEPATV